MAQRKPQLKFERNPWNNFRDNRCHRRKDGRTMDGRTNFDFIGAQAELKICERFLFCKILNYPSKKGLQVSPCSRIHEDMTFIYLIDKHSLSWVFNETTLITHVIP